MIAIFPRVCFPHNTGVFLRPLFFLLILAFLQSAAAAQEIRLRVESLVSPVVSLQGIDATLSLSEPRLLSVLVTRVSLRDRVWRNVALHCPTPRVALDLIECRRGSLQLESAIPVSFSYRPRARTLHLAILPAAGERWEGRIQFHGREMLAELRVENGQLTRLNGLLKEGMPAITAGKLSLDGTWRPGMPGRRSLTLNGSVKDVAFSDQAGLHAGDKIEGDFRLRAEHERDWKWNLSLAWTGGEVFWQPFYLAPSKRTLAASGEADDRRLLARDGRLELERVGSIRFDAEWDRAHARVENLAAAGSDLNLAGLYDTYLKPMWSDRMLGQLSVAGKLDGEIKIRDAKLSSVDLVSDKLALRHENGLFELNEVALNLPWRREGASRMGLGITKGQVWGIPLGAFALSAQARSDALRVDRFSVPVSDGALVVEDFALSHAAGNWRWEARANLQPVSMDELSLALKWPRMHGTLSGVIPRLLYEQQTLTVDGALLFKIFDGTVEVKDLRIVDLLSRASRASGNVDMRGLDLDLLTRAFSFGSIKGRVDVSVGDLELANWRPVRFDAKVQSSPGDCVRRISQRAVENIAALGGASAGAAIQRSFLRFFEQFSYDRIGLACRLDRNVCTMSGIESAGNGYLIVKGGGIPAISVIGYNRHVGWNELLERLSRIRQGGAKPIVQ